MNEGRDQAGEDPVGSGTLPVSFKAPNDDEAVSAAPESRKGYEVRTSVRSFGGFQKAVPAWSARTDDTQCPVSSEGPSHWNAQDTACLPLSGGMAASLVDEILAPANAAFRKAATKLPRVATRTALSINAFQSLTARLQLNDFSIRSSVRMASRVSCTDPFGSRPSSMAEMNSRSINSIPLSDTATSLRSIWFSRPS